MNTDPAPAPRQHPSAEDLLDRGTDPEMARHLAQCPQCRVQARLLARVRQTDPDTLPGIEQARKRLEQGQRQASVTLSASLGHSVGDDREDLPPGTEIDSRYTVEGAVGRGGMGTVYRVRHNELGSIHALKVLHWVSPGIRGRLIREGRAQSRLRHPNVIPVTDVVSVDGAPGLIMELVEGPSLSEWLRQNGRPAVEVADALAVGIIRGVAAAHAAGLVHRDLKPGNVLLAPGDQGPVPKVTDFGLVRWVGPDNADTRLTVSDTPLGTPAYMAPEQLRDASTADQRSDVFSLGALLYELVTGRRAFGGVGWLEITDRVRAGKYDRPDLVAPDLPVRMVRTIERCLRVEPAQRFPDVASVLEAWVAPAASAVTAAQRPGPGWVPRGLLAAAVLSTVLAIGAVPVWLAIDAGQAPTASPGDLPTVAADPGLQRRFELAWQAFLIGDFDTATDNLLWASYTDTGRDGLFATLVYAASLDFAGRRARAWLVLDQAMPYTAERQGRAATLLRLYHDSTYPQARIDGWDRYLGEHPDDFLAFLLAARVADGNPDLQTQYYERAIALAPAGSQVGKMELRMATVRRARRTTSIDGALRSGSLYDGYLNVEGTSRRWADDPATRWETSVPLFRDIVAIVPEDPQGHYDLAVLLGLTGDEQGRQEQLSLLFSPVMKRADRIEYASGDAWFEFGRGRWQAARARLEACQADASSAPPRLGAWDGLFVEAALCADDRAEMALLVEDAPEARRAVESLRGWISQPEIPAELDRRMGASLVYLDARIALLEGDVETATELRARLVDGDYDFVGWGTGEEAAGDLNWRLRGDEEAFIARAYHEARRANGCKWELGYAGACAAEGRLDEAAGVLERIVAGDTCPDGPFVHDFFRAQARVLLAETSLAQGRPAKAREQLDAFDSHWPLADPDHSLVVRAATLAAALDD